MDYFPYASLSLRFLTKGYQRIYSRAFIVGDRNQDRIVYLVLDIEAGDTGIRNGILNGLQRLGPEYAVYNKDNIAVTGTHSHSSTGGWSNSFLQHINSAGLDRPTFDAIVNGSILSIQRAHQSLRQVGNPYMAVILFVNYEF
jgi:neutral ceramidase